MRRAIFTIGAMGGFGVAGVIVGRLTDATFEEVFGMVAGYWIATAFCAAVMPDRS